MKSKVRSISSLKKILRSFQNKGGKVVFTNGCFDLIHYGHVNYLARARRSGDCLVVGLNTDRSVRKLKGDGRPLVSEKDRAGVLSALEPVDFVVLFDEDTPYRLIEALKPDILVKGADYKINDIVGNDIVRQAGGKVVRVPLVDGRSSTGLIEKILKVYGKKK